MVALSIDFLKSIDFAVTKFLMKLFRTSNIDIINNCRSSFNFLLPSEMIEIRNAKFKGRFNMCNSLRYYFGWALAHILVTGSIARSANLPVFSLLRGQF